MSFKQKFAHIINAIASSYPEAKFLYDKQDQTGIIMFFRSHCLIQNNASEQYPDAVHLIFHHGSSPKMVAMISLYCSQLWTTVTVGDNFMIDEQTGDCHSFIEIEDRPSKDTKWQ